MGRFIIQMKKSNWIEWIHTSPLFSRHLDRSHINLTLKSPWYHHTKFNRQATVLLIRLRSKHTTVQKHLHKIQITDTPYWDCVEEQIIETPNHIFFQCKKYEEQRVSQIKTLLKLKYQVPLSIDQLVSNPSQQLGYILLSYLRKIKRTL